MSNQEKFDFKSYVDEPEEQTGEMVQCSSCGKSVHSDALRCLYCGERIELKASFPFKWNKLIFVAIALLIALAFLMRVL